MIPYSRIDEMGQKLEHVNAMSDCLKVTNVGDEYRLKVTRVRKYIYCNQKMTVLSDIALCSLLEVD